MGGTGGTSVRGQGDRVHALVRADQELTERGRGRRVRPQGPRPPVSLGLGASLNGSGGASEVAEPWSRGVGDHRGGYGEYGAVPVVC
jgi:hypothetical protein